jgi:transitional endoplasmic reticulum ATPase
VDNANVIVVAATNRIDMVDTALLRPGRMDHVIFVPPPDYQARLEILKVHTRTKPTVDTNLEDLALRTDGFTGADLENLCNEASLHAVNTDGFDCQYVSGRHFEYVLQWLKPSVTSDDLFKSICPISANKQPYKVYPYKL